jgi:H+-transporting ATPase
LFALLQQNTFGVRSLHGSRDKMMSALYLQVSIISRHSTRSHNLCFTECPRFLLYVALISVMPCIRRLSSVNI